MRIAIHRFGDVPLDVLKELATDLSIFNATIEIGEMLPVPPMAYNEKRNQYVSGILLAAASAQEGDKVLCVASYDMYDEPLHFVFGEAEFGGQRAIISIARLGVADHHGFRERVAKEAIHEMGHTFGLVHCLNPRCVMHFSNELADADFKSKLYCEDCRVRIPTSWRPRQTSLESC